MNVTTLKLRVMSIPPRKPFLTGSLIHHSRNEEALGFPAHEMSLLRALQVVVPWWKAQHAPVHALDLAFAITARSKACTWAIVFGPAIANFFASLVFALPLPFPFSSELLKRDNSSRSDWILLRFANLLSLLACLLRSSLSPPPPLSVSCPSERPGKWANARASEEAIGAPRPPAASQEVAGWRTCSFQ